MAAPPARAPQRGKVRRSLVQIVLKGQTNPTCFTKGHEARLAAMAVEQAPNFPHDRFQWRDRAQGVEQYLVHCSPPSKQAQAEAAPT